MIAVTIFFMAMFTILGVLSAGLHAASVLRNNGPTPAMVAAQFSLTNKMEEGSRFGKFRRHRRIQGLSLAVGNPRGGHQRAV